MSNTLHFLQSCTYTPSQRKLYLLANDTVLKQKRQLSRPYSALDVLQFRQNLQAEAVGLTSGPVASVHVVPQSQHQTHHICHTVALQQSLKERKHKHRINYIL